MKLTLWQNKTLTASGVPIVRSLFNIKFDHRVILPVKLSDLTVNISNKVRAAP